MEFGGRSFILAKLEQRHTALPEMVGARTRAYELRCIPHYFEKLPSL